MEKPTIFTIGHSIHSPEQFHSLLRRHDVTCVVDVRSTPFSRRVPHFNRVPLHRFLKSGGIAYLHMPEEFGARRTNPDVLDQHGRVDFDRVRRSRPFQTGVERLRQGVEKGFKIALMCSEAEPFDCHRFSMISYELVRKGFSVKHILRTGELLDNSELEQRLLRRYLPVPQHPSFFDSPDAADDSIEVAYRRRGQEVAYSPQGAGDE